VNPAVLVASGMAGFLETLQSIDWNERLRNLEMPPLTLDLLHSLALGLALAACAGIRAWLPMFVVGVCVRAGLLPLGDSFQFLGSNTALAVFAIATVIEVIADKIPVVDHALDALSTFLKPVVGVILAASVLWTVDDPIVALALGLMVGAPAALVPHAAKTSLRGVLSPLTAGIAAPILSFLEDFIAFGLIALAILVPLVVAAGFVLFALVTGRFVRKRMKPVQTQENPTPVVTA
jgi:hypothetical protein